MEYREYDAWDDENPLTRRDAADIEADERIKAIDNGDFDNIFCPPNAWDDELGDYWLAEDD